MKKDHLEQVAANAVVVRHVLDQLIEQHVATPRGDVLQGLDLLERWIAGDELSAETLAKTAGAIHSGGGNFLELGAEQRAWSWVGTAVGNLCWMATKERGWVDGNRTVMDGAVYALTSLMPERVDADEHRKQVAEQFALRERLEALRSEALAAARARKKTAKRKPLKRSHAPRLARPEGLGRLGPVVERWLVRCKARIDPRAKVDETALRELLQDKGHVVTNAVLGFEQRYGGLVVGDSPGEEDRDWWFGAWVCLKNGLGDRFRERGLLPVACSSDDLHYYLDQTGTAWAIDAVSDSEPTRFAADGDRMLARIQLYNIHFFRDIRRQTAVLEGLVGERVAEEAGLSPIAQASDEYGRAWGDARRLVLEHASPSETKTMISGPGAKRLVCLA